MTSAAVLAATHAAILLAGFLAPDPYSRQHRDYPYAPPTRLHFVDASGHFHLRPFVCGIADGRPYPLHFFVPSPTGEEAGVMPLPRRLFGVEEPGAVFLLGSDGLGRDVFSRVLYGGQVSLLTGLLAALLSLALGITLGTLAGWFGRWPDVLLMRGAELVMALPWLYLLLAVRAFLPLQISTLQAFFLLIAIIGGVGWVRPARVIRGVVLSGRERPYVWAARGFGARPFYLIRRHVLPQTYAVALTLATVLIPQYILAEVTLSFLGLGVGEPVPSWGNMLADARQFHALASHPWMLAPGLAVVPVLLAYLVLADALSDEPHAG